MKLKFNLAVLPICILIIGITFAGCSKKEESGLSPSVPASSSSSSRTTSAAAATVQEIEPNNDYSTAQIITAGDIVRGSFSSDKDIDFYKIILTESGKLTAWTESRINIYTLNINIYDEEGYLDDWIYGGYVQGRAGDRRVESILEPGIYTLEVEGFESGDYLLITRFERASN